MKKAILMSFLSCLVMLKKAQIHAKGTKLIYISYRNLLLINFPYRLRRMIVDLSLFHKKKLLQVEFIQSTYFEQAIWKSRHRNLGIGIGIGIQI